MKPFSCTFHNFFDKAFLDPCLYSFYLLTKHIRSIWWFKLRWLKLKNILYVIAFSMDTTTDYNIRDAQIWGVKMKRTVSKAVSVGTR